jgi:nicotinamide riboside transporter PnuC
MLEMIIPFLPLMAKVGAYMGIIGGLFNCLTNTKLRIIGFTIWIISNFVLIAWAFEKQEYEMAQMYLFFFVTSGVGLFTHWQLKKKEDAIAKKELEAKNHGVVEN